MAEVVEEVAVVVVAVTAVPGIRMALMAWCKCLNLYLGALLLLGLFLLLLLDVGMLPTATWRTMVVRLLV
jgi:hypothetical protein